MKPRDLLYTARDVLRDMLRFDAAADAVLSRLFRTKPQLGKTDRQILADTVYQVLRHLRLFQTLAATDESIGGAMELRLAILGWSGNAQSLHAALSPEQLEWRKRLLAQDAMALPEAVRWSLPEWLAAALQANYGAEYPALAQAMLRPAPLDLRVNVQKARREAVLDVFARLNLPAQPTPYSPWGVRLEGKPALQDLTVFREGWVEVQDEGSQLLAVLLAPRRGEMVVDFCAGAGGKTLALGAMMRSTGRLYAFDVADYRLAKLKPRLLRSGLSNVYPVAIAHERDERVKRLAGKVDRVLVDAPCSGLGTLRRNPDMKWRQKPEDIAELTTKQANILQSAATLLKPGGRLVYATCSVLPEENSGIVNAFLAAHPDFERVPADAVLRQQGVDGEGLVTQGDLQLLPNRHATDGFYAAVLQRRPTSSGRGEADATLAD
ncbi:MULTISPECIES: RsmB/NOP family class I SAM-dependent RNA methyltransferase [unclassified Thiomonas]|uniref:RsmB/NOP family class I SAM-dependent RNA methyltransferase n=1 Tax=unclassified Thiomonas TaxID=2625466 RepID=UPI0004DBB198|nr:MULTISPECIES: RsmB/NOP family class I SAM-dependent RNA methyltransferase [unclassified Thiomonas]CDW93237.1 Fmu (Sun) domain protein [Thiomonas sp. CB2]VDY06242.1 Fmu (Sun) domain protein [Thiomonas sp. Bio17B3]VDY10462.1 Fmu (Sun) domain protein [Thiomonas sp. Sup16B3]VDY14513.1 putative RIBOSOMAL RNA SMALL SUBUNIT METHYLTRANSFERASE B (SUN) [Thiomonas sp. OC7]VDY16307.1 Fmu (Sun) domain protein [Thiomonas sp. CB2]